LLRLSIAAKAQGDQRKGKHAGVPVPIAHGLPVGHGGGNCQAVPRRHARQEGEQLA
jgi:hypothetical protein